jgi:hypothetical protein
LRRCRDGLDQIVLGGGAAVDGRVIGRLVARIIAAMVGSAKIGAAGIVLVRIISGVSGGGGRRIRRGAVISGAVSPGSSCRLSKVRRACFLSRRREDPTRGARRVA